MKKLLIFILLFVISIVIVYFFLPSTTNGNYGKLIINEICANNQDSYMNDMGEYSDYIEIYNGYNFTVNLSGYHLTDKEYEASMWTFPDIEIAAKSYMIVYASGYDKCSNGVCHTNFKLASSGETVILTDKDNNILSKVTYEEMIANYTYGYNGRKYIYYSKGTPGYENSKGMTKGNDSSKKIDVIITEYMTSNTKTIMDKDGEYNSYIELYNNSKEDINLEGYYLSDDTTNLDKYVIPDVTIKSNDYLIIYVDGKNKNMDGEIHTNFKLSDNDSVIVLATSKKKIIDKMEIVKLKDDMSYGKSDSKMCYYMVATPGYENNTKCYTNLEVEDAST